MEQALYDMQNQKRAELLEELSWTRGFTWEELESLASRMYVRVVEKNQVLFKEGDPANYMAVILDGRILVEKSDQEGDQHPIAELNKGKIFGEMALLDGGQRSATIRTVESTTILALDRKSFDLFQEQNPRAAIKLIRGLSHTVSQRLRQASGKLADELGS